MSWISQNSLALYGAVTGRTIAIVISFFNYRYNVKKDQITLNVSYKEHPKKTENIDLLIDTSMKEPWEQLSCVEVYLVTIRNLSNISIPLHDVGIIDEHGKIHQALINCQFSQMIFLKPLSETDAEALKPKASKTFSVYLSRNEAPFNAISAYAIDQTGKEWKDISKRKKRLG